MARSQFGHPVLVSESGSAERLVPIDLSSSGALYNEQFVQELVFQHPECLPIDEIDRAYENLVPICMELNTPAGPVDGLYLTPTGRLVILEAKLWRNPEARRKVIAQILDYAKEFSQWDYDDLQREVSRRLQLKGNSPFELVRKEFPDLDEAAFVDAVGQSLRRGRFLLLIVGDGIREGVGAIADFLQKVGQLEFTFGLVELSIYKQQERLLVQPRTLARTEIIDRIIVDSSGSNDPLEAAAGPSAERVEPNDLEQFYLEFWADFIADLSLDDPGQPMANITKTGNVFFPLPPSGSQAWVTVFFSQAAGNVGVFVKLIKGQLGSELYEALQEDRKEIDQELPPNVYWDDERFRVVVNKNFGDLRAMESRDAIKAYLASNLNTFINVFRPRLSRLTGQE